MGKNKGFAAERNFIEGINQKKFSEIDETFQKIIQEINSPISSTDFFLAEKKEGTGMSKKTDITIARNNTTFANVSIKSGDNNSVHEESLDSFLDFLKENGISEKECNNIRVFIWGDCSLDGSNGDIDYSKRMNSYEILKAYPKLRKDIYNIFKKVELKLMTRVLCGLENPPDFLVYSKDENFKECFAKEITKIIDDHLAQPFNPKAINLGRMKFQSCNRCLCGQEKKSNKRRDKIQFKWSKMLKD